MDKILVVEDSNILGTLLKKRIELDTGFKVEHAVNYLTALQHLEEGEIRAVVADLNLPDAPQGAMVDYACSKNIPVIVYTGDYDDALRETMWKKNIVDYVLKKDPESDIYIASILKQLKLNRNIDVLVADDSRIIRNSIKNLLEAHLFRVTVCENGQEAFEKALKLPNLKLIVSDYMMPDVSGFDLVRLIRKKFSKEKLAFIGMSREGSAALSSKFIKYGANDFLTKPFTPEQFYCRIHQNLQMIQMVEHISDMSFKDYLTGLYNRRYFFRQMKDVFELDKAKSIAMVDIDFFKKINDSYGHDCGDEVLISFAKTLTGFVGDKGIVARFGGEEFCIFTHDKQKQSYFDTLRKIIEKAPITYNGETIKVTASFGVCSSYGMSLDNMLSSADTLLYKAKEAGRNKVMSEE